MFRFFTFINLIICCISLSAASAEALPVIWNVQNENEYFVGRKDAMEQLSNQLEQGMVTVVGGAGIGKTQLAKKYAISHKHDYDIVWWFDSGKNMEEQFSKLAQEWNRINDEKALHVNAYLPPNEIVIQMKNQLRITKLKWLFIYDNAHDKYEILDYIPENQHGYGRVLATSKTPFSWNHMMKLEKFTRSESIELIVKITHQTEQADKLAEILGDYPLAVAQAASYIKSHPSLSIVDYINLFHTQRIKLWKEEGSDADLDAYKATVSTALTITINEIKKEGAAAFDLLAFCAFLDSKDIPKALLKQYLRDIHHLDDLEQEKIIATLVEYSLISYNNDIDNPTFSIHEVTQLVIRDMVMNQQESYIKKSMSVVVKFLPDKLEPLMSTINNNSSLLSHVDTLTANAKKLNILNNDLFVLYLRALEYQLAGKIDVEASSDIFTTMEAIEPDISDYDDMTRGRFLLMKDALYITRDGDNEKSIEAALEAVSILRKYPTASEELFTAYTDLIQAYNRLGDNENAHQYIILGEKLISKFPDIGNQDDFYFALAAVHLDDGSMSKALVSIEESKKFLSKAEITLMPYHLPLYLLEIEVLVRMEQWDKALRAIKGLSKLADNILPEQDYNITAWLMIFEGYASFSAGGSDNNTARDLLINGQGMLKRLLADEFYQKHMLISLSHRFLGEIYEKQGDNVQAHKEYTTSVQILRNIESVKQMTAALDDLSAVYAKLAISNAKLGDTETAQEYLDLHRQRFGHDHQRTIMITDYFLDHGMKVGY